MPIPIIVWVGAAVAGAVARQAYKNASPQTQEKVREFGRDLVSRTTDGLQTSADVNTLMNLDSDAAGFRYLDKTVPGMSDTRWKTFSATLSDLGRTAGGEQSRRALAYLVYAGRIDRST